MRMVLGETWIDVEELAYNVALDASPRRGRVRCADGRLRTVRLGVPDTFWTIPARIRFGKRTRHGFVTVDGRTNEYTFVLPPTRKPL